ncbi:hypothetical protein, partial [Stenotrophomonas maltophilia]|uniref:hypothetical protein n=1 Tax=Stenotrophomonas maltophilia TaxID=40324 RepID=UPI00195491DE
RDIGLVALGAGEGHLVALEKAAHEGEAVYRKAAEALSAKRKATAIKLDAAVNAELGPLKLDRARFITEMNHD